VLRFQLTRDLSHELREGHLMDVTCRLMDGQVLTATTLPVA
jgi:hypothetical protein